MRLIDADKLKETLLHYNYTTEHNQIFRYINEQPTAYSVEKVVEDLEELKFLRQWKSDVVDEFCEYDCNSVGEAIHNGYIKGIDDFVNFGKSLPVVEEEDGTIRPMFLEEMAEKLKAGEKE